MRLIPLVPGVFCYFLSSKSRLKKAMIERTARGLPRSVITRLSKFYVLSCKSSLFSENKILALHCTFFIDIILYQRQGDGICHLPVFDIRVKILLYNNFLTIDNIYTGSGYLVYSLSYNTIYYRKSIFCFNINNPCFYTCRC